MFGTRDDNSFKFGRFGQLGPRLRAFLIAIRFGPGSENDESKTGGGV